MDGLDAPNADTAVTEAETGEKPIGLVFLTGLPRSGTKLLRNLLCRHSRVDMPRIEAAWIPRLRSRIGSGAHLMAAEDLQTFDAIVGASAFALRARDSGIQLPELASESVLQGQSLIYCLTWFLREAQGVDDASDVLVGDKSPSHLGSLELLAQLDPDLRIVHIVRDPRDQVLSAFRAWGKSPVRGAWRWARAVQEAELWGAAHREYYCRVRYEDLCTEPEATMRTVLDFLRLPFEDDVVALVEPPEKRGDTRGRTDIVSSNSGKWATAFTPRRLRRIEGLAVTVGSELGYALQGPAQRLGLLGRCWLRGMDTIELLRRRVRERGLFGGLKFMRAAFRDRMRVG